MRLFATVMVVATAWAANAFAQTTVNETPPQQAPESDVHFYEFKDGKYRPVETSPEVHEKLNEMFAAVRNGDYATGLAKAKEIDAIPDKPETVSQQIRSLIFIYAMNGKNYAAALEQVEKLLANGEGDKVSLLKQARDLSILLNDPQKTAEFKEQLGPRAEEPLRPPPPPVF